MIRFFIEPLLMITGASIIVGLMYAGSLLYEKHKKEENK